MRRLYFVRIGLAISTLILGSLLSVRATDAAPHPQWPGAIIGTWKGTTCGQAATFTFYYGKVKTTQLGPNGYSDLSDAIIAVSKIIWHGSVRYDQFFLGPKTNPENYRIVIDSVSSKSSIDLGYDVNAMALNGRFFVWQNGCDVYLTKQSSAVDRELSNRPDSDYYHMGDVFG